LFSRIKDGVASNRPFLLMIDYEAETFILQTHQLSYCRGDQEHVRL